MLHKLRQRMADERGFTLIELLVVILIIGILAAIALPAFLNQRAKAQDSEAKSAARTAQTAMETYYTDTQAYTTTKGDLVAIEPAIKQFEDRLTIAGATAPAVGYTVTVESKSTHKTDFAIKAEDGTVTRTCDKPGKGGCPSGSGATSSW